MLYSSAVSNNLPLSPNNKTPDSRTGENARQPQSQPPKRAPSPAHVPRTAASDEEPVYVLTLLTDKAHHDRMTELRKTYFPRRLNKLAAHLTLYHALPASRLDSDIVPAIQELSSKMSPFKVLAEEPFRMKKGFAVSISGRDGGRQGKQIHQALQDAWRDAGFLSEQDAGGCRLHYTLMNKVDDEAEVAKAYSEFQGHWKPDAGTVEGLALWRYDRGYWKWERMFGLQATSGSPG